MLTRVRKFRLNHFARTMIRLVFLSTLKNNVDFKFRTMYVAVFDHSHAAALTSRRTDRLQQQDHPIAGKRDPKSVFKNQIRSCNAYKIL